MQEEVSRFEGELKKINLKSYLIINHFIQVYAKISDGSEGYWMWKDFQNENVNEDRILEEVSEDAPDYVSNTTKIPYYDYKCKLIDDQRIVTDNRQIEF